MEELGYGCCSCQLHAYAYAKEESHHSLSIASMTFAIYAKLPSHMKSRLLQWYAVSQPPIAGFCAAVMQRFV